MMLSKTQLRDLLSSENESLIAPQDCLPPTLTFKEGLLAIITLQLVRSDHDDSILLC